MNDALAVVALAHLTRDELRKNPPPFRDGCLHQMAALPVIDFVADEVCLRCGGFVTQSIPLMKKCPACGGAFGTDQLAPDVLPNHVNQQFGSCPGSGVTVKGGHE